MPFSRPCHHHQEACSTCAVWLAMDAKAEHMHYLKQVLSSLLRSLVVMGNYCCIAVSLNWPAMYVQLRDADVANAELVEEKRLSRELSAQVQEFIQGRTPSSSRTPH